MGDRGKGQIQGNHDARAMGVHGSAGLCPCKIVCNYNHCATYYSESQVGSMHDSAGLTFTSFTVTLQQTSTRVTGLGLRLVALPQLRRARGNYKAGHKGDSTRDLSRETLMLCTPCP